MTWLKVRQKILMDTSPKNIYRLYTDSNKHSKRCFTSHRMENANRNNEIPLPMAKRQTTDNTKCWWGCGAIRILIHCWWKYKIVQPLWKTVWQYPIKINILLSYNQTITFLSIYPNELKTCVHRKMCT